MQHVGKYRHFSRSLQTFRSEKTLLRYRSDIQLSWVSEQKMDVCQFLAKLLPIGLLIQPK